MDILKTAALLLVVFVLWQLRPLAAAGVGWAIFLVATPLYKKRAERAVRLINKIDDEEDQAEFLRTYRHQFLGIKLMGLITLVVYAYTSAWLIWLLLPIGWIFIVIFVATLLLNWGQFVSAVSISYLSLVNAQMETKV